MNTIRRIFLGFLGVALQVIAVEAKRGGGGGKSKGGGGGKKGGLGAIWIGIIIGALVFLYVIITVVGWFRKRFRSRSTPEDNQPCANAPSKEQDFERNPMMGYPPQDPPGYPTSPPPLQYNQMDWKREGSPVPPQFVPPQFQPAPPSFSPPGHMGGPYSPSQYSPAPFQPQHPPPMQYSPHHPPPMQYPPTYPTPPYGG